MFMPIRTREDEQVYFLIASAVAAACESAASSVCWAASYAHVRNYNISRCIILQLTVIVIVSVVNPIAAQCQQFQRRWSIEATYESMLLGSSLGALKEEICVSEGQGGYCYRALYAGWRTREEGRRMRIEEDIASVR